MIYTSALVFKDPTQVKIANPLWGPSGSIFLHLCCAARNKMEIQITSYGRTNLQVSQVLWQIYYI